MSTTRYSFAGAPGTGTITSNMDSRLKVNLNLAGSTAAPTIRYGALNVASITDSGVGSYRVNVTAPFVGDNATPVVTAHVMSNWVNSNTQAFSTTAVSFQVQTCENAVLIDVDYIYIHAAGPLA